MESHPTGLAALEDAKGRVRSVWMPPPDLTVSQWAERFRMMVKGTTSRPGPWRSEVYQREIMDALCDPLVTEVPDQPVKARPGVESGDEHLVQADDGQSGHCHVQRGVVEQRHAEQGQREQDEIHRDAGDGR